MHKLVFKSLDIPEIVLQSDMTIGRDSSNDVVLPLPTVSGEHAKIKVNHDNVVLQDLDSTNGTYVNNKRIFGDIKINHGDVIMFDQVVADLVEVAINNGESTTIELFLTTEDGVYKSNPVRLCEPSIYTIGRNPAATISLESQGVSWSHAKIYFKNDNWVIKDLGSTNGTYLNEKKITEARLVAGDQVRFETVVFSVVEVLGHDIGKSIKTPKSHGNERIDYGQFLIINGEQVPLLSSLVTIGRADNNDIVLDDITVSANHARLFFDAGKWWIEDLKSTNGTKLNGHRIERQKLLSDDSLCLGNQEIAFVDTACVPPTTAPSVVIRVDD